MSKDFVRSLFRGQIQNEHMLETPTLLNVMIKYASIKRNLFAF